MEVLPNQHNETAYLEIRTYEACNLQQVAPLVVPREGDSDNLSLFVNHLDAVQVRREQMAAFFAEKVAKYQDGITADNFLMRLKHQGFNFLDVTGGLIAESLPFFTASFKFN